MLYDPFILILESKICNLLKSWKEITLGSWAKVWQCIWVKVVEFVKTIEKSIWPKWVALIHWFLKMKIKIIISQCPLILTLKHVTINLSLPKAMAWKCRDFLYLIVKINWCEYERPLKENHKCRFEVFYPVWKVSSVTNWFRWKNEVGTKYWLHRLSATSLLCSSRVG